MAEEKQKKIALDLRSLATGGTQEAELNDEQLDEVSGGVNKELKDPDFIRS